MTGPLLICSYVFRDECPFAFSVVSGKRQIDKECDLLKSFMHLNYMQLFGYIQKKRKKIKRIILINLQAQYTLEIKTTSIV
jgi:hypothetical protein